MPEITIQLSEAELFALSVAALDPAKFVQNAASNRARVMKEELKSDPNWTSVAVAVAQEGGDANDDWAVILKGKDLGHFLTAAQIVEAQEAASATEVEVPAGGTATAAAVDQQLVLRKMALTGAENRAQLDEIIQRGLREGMAIMQARSERELTEAEQARAAELEQFNVVMTAMEAARDAIKSDVVDGSITTIEEIQADARWPSV